jgi:replicative DNA helicase
MLDGTRDETPRNIDVEQALLGAILIDNATLDRITGILEPEDFSEPVHARLFEIIGTLRRDNVVASHMTLRPFVIEWPSITPELPVWKYVGKLMVEATSIANARSYAETIRDFSARRKLADAGKDMQAAAGNPMIPVTQTASLAVEALDHVLSVSRSKGRKATGLGDAMRDMLDGFANDDGSNRITTGLSDLDKVTGGWRRKQVAILGGRPSMGKTSVANAAMLRTARAGHGVMCFSLEMATDALAARCLSDLSWSPDRRIPYADALAGRLPERDLHLWAQTALAWKKLPLTIDDQRGLSIAEIGARVRAEAQRMERNGIRLGLVVVDHLGLVKPSGRYAGNKVQEVGEISDGLCALAKEQDVAVLALHQLNRGTEGRENKRPTLADLRNSGDLEQDADVVCFAYRESYYLERMKYDAGSQNELQRETSLEACRNTLELLIAKNRNGPTQTVTLFCDMACNVVRDAS